MTLQTYCCGGGGGAGGALRSLVVVEGGGEVENGGGFAVSVVLEMEGGGVTYRMPGHLNNNILIENTITNGPVV